MSAYFEKDDIFAILIKSEVCLNYEDNFYFLDAYNRESLIRVWLKLWSTKDLLRGFFFFSILENSIIPQFFIFQSFSHLCILSLVQSFLTTWQWFATTNNDKHDNPRKKNFTFGSAACVGDHFAIEQLAVQLWDARCSGNWKLQVWRGHTVQLYSCTRRIRC